MPGPPRHFSPESLVSSPAEALRTSSAVGLFGVGGSVFALGALLDAMPMIVGGTPFGMAGVLWTNSLTKTVRIRLWPMLQGRQRRTLETDLGRQWLRPQVIGRSIRVLRAARIPS